MKTRYSKSLGLALLGSLVISTSLPLVETAKAEQIVSQAPLPSLSETNTLPPKEREEIQKNILDLETRIDQRLNRIITTIQILIAALGLSPALFVFLLGFFAYVARKGILSEFIKEELRQRTEKEHEELAEKLLEKFNEYIIQFSDRQNFLVWLDAMPTQAIFQRYPIAKEQEELMNKYIDLLNKIEESSKNKIKFMPDEYVSKGDIHFYKGEYDEAINAYKKALESKPDNSQLIEIDARKANFISKRSSKSFWCEAHCKLGDALAGLGGKENNRTAKNEYEAALDIDPKYYWALHSWGDALYNLEKYEDAIKKFDEALAIELKVGDTDAQRTTYKRKGVTFATLGQYEEAEKEYNKSVELESKLNEQYRDCWLWHCRGDTLYMLRKFNEALDDYNSALEIKPNNPESLYKKGLTLSQLKFFEDAKDDFEKAYKQEDRDLLEKSQFWYHWGRSLLELSQNQEGEDAEASRNQAKIKYDNAQQKLRSEMRNRPENPEGWYHNASFLAIQSESETDPKKQKTVNEAIQSLVKALKLASKCKEWARHEPDFDGIREEPGFKQLVNC
jgi:tetratricopeptide (TPR) repeat protein